MPVLKEAILRRAREGGFRRARIAAPFGPTASALVVALPYGQADEMLGSVPPAADGPWARLDDFSRRNYYQEAVVRLKRLAADLRQKHGGAKSDYRIFCNSTIPERPIAVACGLGTIGRNSLLMTPDAGSRVIIALMRLPFELSADQPLGPALSACGGCRACVAACPAQALPGDGTLDRTRCIQQFASRPGPVPAEIAAVWGNRLYGCSACRDACPANRTGASGVQTDRGALPEYIPIEDILRSSDDELRARFKGTALGMSWLGPAAVRRNATLAKSYGDQLHETDERIRP